MSRGKRWESKLDSVKVGGHLKVLEEGGSRAGAGGEFREGSRWCFKGGGVSRVGSMLFSCFGCVYLYTYSFIYLYRYSNTIFIRNF